MAFQFDPTIAPEKNILKFYEHMATVNEEFAELLKSQLPKLLPIPEGQSQRQTARSHVNSTVIKHLDILPTGPAK